MPHKRSKSTRDLPRLSDLEMEVMDVVWRLGECGSAQVIEAFAAQKRRRLADTTIRTVLTKLREKGYIELIPSVQRSYLFRAAVPRQAVAKRSVNELLRRLFEGSPRQAIAHLLNEEEVSDSDLDEIRRMINARTRKKGKK